MHYRTSRATDFLTSASLIYSKKSMGGFVKGIESFYSVPIKKTPFLTLSDLMRSEAMSDNNVSSNVRKQQTELKRMTES